MLSSLLLVLLPQVIACTPGETSMVCHCNQGQVPRFVARAKDKQAHCGYQEWHRKVDDEVIDWLDKNPEATPEKFMEKLREIYSRPEMKAKFPHGF